MVMSRRPADTAEPEPDRRCNGSLPSRPCPGQHPLVQQGALMATSATIPNSDIVFRRDGVGERAVVFMHGWTDDLHVWGPVIAELSGSGFETVQLDLAGFGDRTQADGPFTFDRFAADLLAVVDAVDKPFVLVGHSMAAPVVELVAEAAPPRAVGLVPLARIPM